MTARSKRTTDRSGVVATRLPVACLTVFGRSVFGRSVIGRSTARLAVAIVLILAVPVLAVPVLAVPDPAVPVGAVAVDRPTPPPLPTPALRADCTHADTTRGVAVSWEAGPSSVSMVEIERADGDDGEFETVYEVDRAGDLDLRRGDWTDADLSEPAPDAGSTRYLLTVSTSDGEQLTVPCSWARGNIGRFSCSVSLAPAVEPGRPAGHLVEWHGGPTGPGLEYLIERRVQRHVDGGRFEERGRTTERTFSDVAAERMPTYRVTVRFDEADALTVECATDRILALLAVDAEFVCPAPGTTFVDTFGADRDGGARRHQGVDMFAAVGSPVVAPESGELVFFWNVLGGRSFGLYADSGTFYYGAHLDSYVGGERRVVAGELIGTVGNTGNAVTTPPHLHFEVHPDGRRTPAVNPTVATQRACSGA